MGRNLTYCRIGELKVCILSRQTCSITLSFSTGSIQRRLSVPNSLELDDLVVALQGLLCASL